MIKYPNSRLLEKLLTEFLNDNSIYELDWRSITETEELGFITNWTPLIEKISIELENLLKFKQFKSIIGSIESNLGCQVEFLFTDNLKIIITPKGCIKL